jgi:hypothetical protein
MLDVLEVNILKPKDEQRRHWRRFPASYLQFLKCFIYQSQLYLDSLDSITTNARKLPGTAESVQKSKHHPKSNPKVEAIRTLKHYIHYMDNVIMQIWEDTRTAAVKDELGPDWRCSALDEWLLVEYHVKRHDTPDVEKYYAQTSLTDWMSSDPFELGKLIHILDHLPIRLMHCRLDRIRAFRSWMASRRCTQLHHFEYEKG